MTTLPDILTPAEIASHARVSARTIVDMANRGDIPGAFKVGKQWRFHADIAVPHVCPRPDNVPAPCPVVDPASVLTNAPTAHGGSAGEKLAGNAKKAGSTPNRKRKTTRTRSGSAFARDFPEHANIVRSAS